MLGSHLKVSQPSSSAVLLNKLEPISVYTGPITDHALHGWDSSAELTHGLQRPHCHANKAVRQHCLQDASLHTSPASSRRGGPSPEHSRHGAGDAARWVPQAFKCSGSGLCMSTAGVVLMMLTGGSYAP